MSSETRPVFRSMRILEERPLLSLLPRVPDDRRFAFVQGDEGVIGWGAAATIPVGTGPDRFRRAQDALAGLGDDEHPIAFASFTFDPDEDASVVTVPEVSISRRNGVTTRIDAYPSNAVSLPGGTLGRRAVPTAATRDRPRYAGTSVRDEQWLDAVAACLERIESGDLEKVVLARDVNLWSRNSFDSDAVLEELARRFPLCATFLVDHLIGASPELLLSRRGRSIRSRVLAGTAPRGEDDLADAAAGSALLSSDKDRREHAIALRSALEALETVCSDLSVPDAPSLVQLDNVQHLGSEIVGSIHADTSEGDAHILSVLARLHPTAAVGGSPRAEAMRSIRELERMPRGRYSGPVGWCNPRGDGEFAIALRCGEIRGDRARLFAGAGIVHGSRPEEELTETWLKLQAMVGVLGA